MPLACVYLNLHGLKTGSEIGLKLELESMLLRLQKASMHANLEEASSQPGLAIIRAGSIPDRSYYPPQE